MATATPVLVSYEESLLRPESNREEVIHGELHIMPPATLTHNIALRALMKQFDGLLSDSLDCVWGSGFLIAERPKLRFRIPDLAVVDVAVMQDSLRRQSKADPYGRFAPVAVIEVLSPSNRKGSEKQLLSDYLDLGVAEILFLDPAKQTILLNGAPQPGESVMLAGVTLDLNAIWDLFR